jgi:hypothetical protein
LVRDLMAGMPDGAALLVTSDHGQVEVGDNLTRIDEEIATRCYMFSGEGRFKWLHAKEETSIEELLTMCQDRYGDIAWVRSRQQIIDDGWFGGPLEDKVVNRLGDVALVASSNTAFVTADESTDHVLQCRHGSMTSAEMLVPLLAQLK